MNAACREAFALKELTYGLATFDLEAQPSSPAELAAMLKANTDRWTPLDKAIGLPADA